MLKYLGVKSQDMPASHFDGERGRDRKQRGWGLWVGEREGTWQNVKN